MVVMPRRVEAGGQPNLGCVTKDMGLARSTEISGFQMVMTSGQYVVKSRLGWHIDLCQEARKMTQPSESVWARVKKPHSTSIRFTSILQPGVVGERPPDRPQLFDHHSPGLWLCWLWGGLIIADGTLHEPRMLQGVAPQTRKSESRAKLG